jgi:hypothetical protein
MPKFDGEVDFFPYHYTPEPNSNDIYGGVGTGAITGVIPEAFFQCYKFKGTATGTASPTGFYTPAPTIPLSDFTKFAGSCLDSLGDYYTSVSSYYKNYTDDAAMDAHCLTWCGQ